MKKTARLIIFLVALTLSFSSFAQLTSADYLIRPIVEEPMVDGQWLMVNEQPITSNQSFDGVYPERSRGIQDRQLTISNQQSIIHIPSITFGDLLNSSYSTIQGASAIDTSNKEALGDSSSRAQAIKNLLAQLEASYREFSNNQSFDLAQDKPFDLAQDKQPSSPTPYIPVPTLLAGVSEIVASNVILSPDLIGTKNPQRYSEIQKGSFSRLGRDQDDRTGELDENPIKTTYTIALLGDSMVDTLGKDLPHLRELLKLAYPKYSFALLNYGQGGTDLESGLFRLTNHTKYLEVGYPPLLSYKPDILVIESFAYNHWGGHFYDLDRQWLTIAKIIDTVKENSPDTKIILAATIAPNAQIFGDGVLNWTKEKKWESATITRAYLQNLVNFATSQNFPLANTYHPSLGMDGNGLPQYINQGDHLHPSGEGALLFSQKIVEAIKNNKLIE